MISSTAAGSSQRRRGGRRDGNGTGRGPAGAIGVTACIGETPRSRARCRRRAASRWLVLFYGAWIGPALEPESMRADAAPPSDAAPFPRRLRRKRRNWRLRRADAAVL